MNQLTVKGVLTMSSREIARLLQSKHGDVKSSAERLAAARILTAPLGLTPYEHPQSRQIYEEYWFNKRDSLVIPLCRECHDKLHANLAAFEQKHGTQQELLFWFLNRVLGIGVIKKG